MDQIIFVDVDTLADMKRISSKYGIRIKKSMEVLLHALICLGVVFS